MVRPEDKDEVDQANADIEQEHAHATQKSRDLHS